MCPPAKVNGVWPFNDAWLRTSVVVGQTPGATQRCLKPGFSERIRNSRRTGGAPDLLRLSGRTLDSSPDHERHRIAVRHGPLAATGHQGGRLPHQGPTDGLQVARHGPAAVAATQCRTPAAARAGWCGLHRRSAAGTKHRGGSEGSRLITLIADPQLLTISPSGPVLPPV